MARSTAELPPNSPTQPGFAYFSRKSVLLIPVTRWMRVSATVIGSPDSEVLEGLRGPLVGDRDVRHARLFGAAIAPLDQLLHLLAGPLRHGLDPAVVQVPHPARHPDPLRRPLAVPAVAHPLHDPGDQQARADLQSFRKTPTTTPWIS